MKYSVTITHKAPELLAEIERGNPVRTFHTATLSGAVALANAALFAAGQPMRKGPRSLRVHYLHVVFDDVLRVELLRRS